MQYGWNASPISDPQSAISAASSCPKRQRSRGYPYSVFVLEVDAHPRQARLMPDLRTIDRDCKFGQVHGDALPDVDLRGTARFLEGTEKRRLG